MAQQSPHDSPFFSVFTSLIVYVSSTPVLSQKNPLIAVCIDRLKGGTVTTSQSSSFSIIPVQDARARVHVSIQQHHDERAQVPS